MGVIIVAMVLGFTLIVVKMGLDYSRTKLQELDQPPADATLLMSELQDIIASSVEEAVEPLKMRIEQLEAHQLPAPDPVKQLASPVSEAEASDSPMDRA